MVYSACGIEATDSSLDWSKVSCKNCKRTRQSIDTSNLTSFRQEYPWL